MSFQIGDLVSRQKPNGRVEKGVVTLIQTDGSNLVDGAQTAASVEQPIVTAVVVVEHEGRLLKTRASRTFVGKGHGMDGMAESMPYALEPRQEALYEASEAIVASFGLFDKGTGGNGAHYMAGIDNPFSGEGLQCANCCFYRGGRGCEIVAGDIDPRGLCKLWIIAEPLLNEPSTDVATSYGNVAAMGLGMSKASSVDERARVLKAADEARFTLAPWYIPNTYDAQNEWTDTEELQKALWDYVRDGNREIKLQHNNDVRAGEWVEAMTLPYEWAVPVHKSGGGMGSHVYPAGTVLLGVVWDDWAWDMVKSGQITGFSIGGSAERLDLPMSS